MDFGEDPNGSSDSQRRSKKRYHRHTPRQIQQLEGLFKECPHPDEKQRHQLSRELGLEPRQIKFWFQNRRTQMKAQHERADNCNLRAENDRIRVENIAIREALKNVVCPTCGGTPSPSDDSFFDEQKLRLENVRLKEELDRISTMASKYLGRPMTHIPPVQQIAASSLDLSVGAFGLSLDLDLLPSNSTAGTAHAGDLTMVPAGISEMEKALMAEVAAVATEEIVRLVQADDPVWVAGDGGREALNHEGYARLFPRWAGTQPDARAEASRGSEVVVVNAAALVDMFMDSSKWAELFPTIVAKAKTIEVLATGAAGSGCSRSGSLLLMYGELQVLSPLVTTRELYFVRYCQQIEQGLWVISDVSVDFSRDNRLMPVPNSRRLPSGCLIQDMPNGCSKVSWVEHMEIEEKTPTHRLYRDLVEGGSAFAAQRWLATLKRMCERFACLMGTSNRDIGGVIQSADAKRSMMKLSQRMVGNFCTSLSASNNQRWTTLSGLNDIGVRVTVHKSTDVGQPNGVVLSAATSIWLPVSCNTVFAFFKDERTRSQWDVLSNGNSVQEVARIVNGSHQGNCISLLRAFNSSQNNMLILQESCTDPSGSLVVYAPVDLPGMNVVMSGEDTSQISLLPSGFTILPDGRSGDVAGASTSSGSTTSGGGGGSLITVAFQILVSSLPSAKLNLESVTTVNNLISTTVQQIKVALNCPSA